MKGRLREVITDTGIFYYRIKKESILDEMNIYRLRSIKIPIINRSITYKSKLEGPNWGGCWYIHAKTSKNRLEEIKKILDDVANGGDFDPNWDGVLIRDKAKLRDVLIDDILK